MKHSHKFFPATRYQGSKFKLLDWLDQHFSSLHFDRALDAFSGTSSVSYLLKSQNKKVVSNDLLRFNSVISKGLVENNDNKIDDQDISFIFNDQGIRYRSFIQDHFSDIYYTDQENIWLDRTIQNINLIDNEYKKAMLLWCLFQSCITKRPYGLFHRKNLHIRTKDVERSFGNKKTWDTPFDVHFLKFSEQINNAIFSTDSACSSLNKNIFDVEENHFDLVYLDPPYIPASGSLTKYGDFYHFLEGISFYDEWPAHLDHNKKHLPFLIETNPLEDKNANVEFLTRLFDKFKGCIIVMSYRSDGIPSESEIFHMLENTHKKVIVNNFDHQYVLSKKRTKEVLFTAFPY